MEIERNGRGGNFGDYYMNTFRWNYLMLVRDTVMRCLLKNLGVVRMIAHSIVLNQVHGYELRR